jgi:hypothetical protein
MHLASGGSEDAFTLWHQWSAGKLTGKTPANYKGEEDCRKTWNSFRHETDNPVTLATIYALANKAGHEGHKGIPSELQPESLTLDQMLARFVQITRGPVIVDLQNTRRKLRPHEFAAAYAHDYQVVGRKPVPTTVVWSRSDGRMTAERLTFHPGEGQFFEEGNLRHFNIWLPPNWSQVDVSLAALFIDHLEYLIPNERQRNDLLDWLSSRGSAPCSPPTFSFLVSRTEGGHRQIVAR